MVKVQQKEVTALVGCSSFTFKAIPEIEYASGLCLKDRADQELQTGLVDEIINVLSRFEKLPCEMRIKLVVKNGEGIAEGIAQPYDNDSEEEAKKLINQLREKTHDFARCFPHSHFTFVRRQSIEITEAYPLE